MKKWFVASAFCLAAITNCTATEVHSVNVAGVVNIPASAGEFKLTCVDIAGIGHAQTLQSLFGDEAVAAENYALADVFIFWDPAEAKYNQFAKYSGDGEFYLCNTQDDWDNGSPTNPVIPVGEGFWIRCNPTQSNIFTITGQAVDNDEVAIDIITGFQLVGYPYSAEIVLDDTDFANDGATASSNFGLADKTVFWEGSSYQAYALFDGDMKWYGCNTIDEWDNGTKPGSEKVIAIAEGFWYIANSAFEWTEAVPYTLD